MLFFLSIFLSCSQLARVLWVSLMHFIWYLSPSCVCFLWTINAEILTFSLTLHECINLNFCQLHIQACHTLHLASFILHSAWTALSVLPLRNTPTAWCLLPPLFLTVEMVFVIWKPVQGAIQNKYKAQWGIVPKVCQCSSIFFFWTKFYIDVFLVNR